MKKLFGTDGVRGEANKEPMTVETILLLAKSAACILRQNLNLEQTVLIGKDTRASGYMFETALASGLCSMGVDVMLVGPISTPGVAFLTTAMRAGAGAVISASHNPYYDNGVKFFGPDGFKLSDDMESQIESLMNDPNKLSSMSPGPKEIGKAIRLDDARGRYITYLKYNFPKSLTLRDVKIVLDCSHGATYRIAPSVFGELAAETILMGNAPDGFNINDGCGALYPDQLAEKVRVSDADIGIAFDGDGDRVIMVDEKGHLFDGDDILGNLAPWLHSKGELGAGVVGTVMSNYGLEEFLKIKKIPFYRAPVGDRYVVEKMKETGCLWGGEPSGHLVSLFRSTTGDGILSALLMLTMMCEEDKPLSAYSQMISKCPQLIQNIHVREKKDLALLTKVSRVIAEAESDIGAKGRVLVRYSGTEPKARVMVEGFDESKVQKWVSAIAEAIYDEIGTAA